MSHMRMILTSLLVLACSGCPSRNESEISVRNLNDHRRAIGWLGLPLGTVTTVEAEVVSGDRLSMKALQSDSELHLMACEKEV